ncbi:MAG: hypothetical protein OXI11_01130 [Gammaproteobacteria bacterium]|nr:hypothetical protein [Gammaproteobacteria bacterium]MXW46387.1 GIY-YIG nuclease family protein [Gammaproteobacteria bacterium]MYD01228.1 GIY-YIG nuclease family protein [Gammaproteobacteria bacterium]MYI26386.1 GIY-YIG nuclease family protein [Gammaproteobacteria bacterium]
MSAAQVVSWGGYDFNSYDPAQTNWNDVPGIYIFAGMSTDGRWWRAKYVGQTSSFSERLGGGNNSHERWKEAKRKGATHVHARVVHNEMERRSLESMLIETYDPPLNAT